MSTPQPPRRRRIAGEPRPDENRPDERPQAPAAPAPPARRPRRPKPTAEPADRTPDPAEPRQKIAPPVPRTPRPSARPASSEDESSTSSTAKVALTKPAPEPPTSTPPSGSQGPRGTWSKPLVALAVLAALAVAFGITGAVAGVRTWSDDRGLAAGQADAAQTAAEDMEQIFSYRYDRLDEHLKDAQELMTPSFAKEFETISPALNDLAPQRRIQVEATSREAAAIPCGNDCSPDKATVLVFFDQARLADGSTTPTVFGSRVTVSMERSDNGRWLVDDIKAL